MTLIECKINGHTYATEPLYFEDFTTLGFIAEEKIVPLLVCLFACIANNLTDAELLKALYNSCKDVFNREDLKYISNLVLNKEHLIIDGKKPDYAEWEKHWQSAGFIEYKTVVIKFIEANLGNFTSLSALLPERAKNIENCLKEKLSSLLNIPKNQSAK